MIHIYIKAQPHIHTMLQDLLKDTCTKKHIPCSIHEFTLPFHGQDQRNFICCEVQDDTMVRQLKQLKETQGHTDLILIASDSQILTQYAPLRLFGWIISTTLEESINALLPAWIEEMVAYECSIQYHSRFLNFTLHPDRIIYMESYRHDVYIHTDTIQLKLRGVLKDYRIENAYIHLLQVHKSYIVNLKYVKELQGNELILSNDASIPIGEAYKTHLNELLGTYLRTKSQ